MRAALLLYFLAASPALAAEMWTDPPDPTNQTSINFHYSTRWHEGCVPWRVQVTRDASRVNVVWREVSAGCVQAVVPWHAVVPLGVFEAGVYEVVPQVLKRDGTILADRPFPLVVRDDSAPWTISPLYASTGGGSEIDITLDDHLCLFEPETVSIMIDGVPVAARDRGDCRYSVNTPPGKVGTGNATVTIDGVEYTSGAAFRYVDPDAAPDPAVAERVLIPILYSGPGAFGSQWVTEATIRNSRMPLFDWYRFRPCSSSQCGTPVPTGLASLMTLFGPRPEGLILFFDRAPNSVALSSFIRETSRQQSWGAEIPVVRERDFRRDYVSFSNVPRGGGYRTTLRIYGIDGVIPDMSISAGPQPITLFQVASCSSLPCNSDRPAYAAVDLTAALAGAGATTVSVSPQAPGVPGRFWAFITVTHNETQAVTVITPETTVTP